MNRGVKVETKADFSVIRETLSRLGIVSQKKKTITPSCYIVKDGDEHFICHFKELLGMFDENPEELSEKDRQRRNTIATMLENWALIEIIDNGVYQEKLSEKIQILKYEDKVKEKYFINHKFKSFHDLENLNHGVRC